HNHYDTTSFPTRRSSDLENISDTVSTTSFHFSTTASHIPIATFLIDSQISAKNSLIPLHKSAKNVTVLSHATLSASHIAMPASFIPSLKSRKISFIGSQ